MERAFKYFAEDDHNIDDDDVAKRCWCQWHDNIICLWNQILFCRHIVNFGKISQNTSSTPDDRCQLQFIVSWMCGLMTLSDLSSLSLVITLSSSSPSASLWRSTDDAIGIYWLLDWSVVDMLLRSLVLNLLLLSSDDNVIDVSWHFCYQSCHFVVSSLMIETSFIWWDDWCYRHCYHVRCQRYWCHCDWRGKG